MATFNSNSARTATRGLFLIFWLGAGFLAAAQDNTRTFAARSEAEFLKAEKKFQSNTNDVTAAWKFASACFDFADFATNNAEHATIARQGIAASRQAISRDPGSAPAHYYLALNQGQLARVETFGALRLVREMDREFTTSFKLDPHFDYAGAARALGLLYRDAPLWPVSIGSHRKALSWLNEAEQLAPDYPENRLNLAETFLQWHQFSAASRELQKLDALWPTARKSLTGPEWERSWADWSARRDQVRNRLQEISGKSKNGH